MCIEDTDCAGNDDWDQDYTNERTLVRTAVRPDPKFVKWINPDIKPGERIVIAADVTDSLAVRAAHERVRAELETLTQQIAGSNFLLAFGDPDGDYADCSLANVAQPAVSRAHRRALRRWAARSMTRAARRTAGSARSACVRPRCRSRHS